VSLGNRLNGRLNEAIVNHTPERQLTISEDFDVCATRRGLHQRFKLVSRSAEREVFGTGGSQVSKDN
jgi:hypothetical protein